MSDEFTIRSEAQRKMFERSANDRDYARSRGIDPDFARRAIEAHAKGGDRKLPARVEPAKSSGRGPAKAASPILMGGHSPKLFGA